MAPGVSTILYQHSSVVLMWRAVVRVFPTILIKVKVLFVCKAMPPSASSLIYVRKTTSQTCVLHVYTYIHKCIYKCLCSCFSRYSFIYARQGSRFATTKNALQDEFAPPGLLRAVMVAIVAAITAGVVDATMAHRTSRKPQRIKHGDRRGKDFSRKGQSAHVLQLCGSGTPKVQVPRTCFRSS